MSLLSGALHRHSMGAPTSRTAFTHTALRFRNRPGGSSAGWGFHKAGRPSDPRIGMALA
jgi:hypothetical protein